MNVLITNRCNASCQYCFLKDDLVEKSGRGDEITLEDFALLLNYADHLISIGVTDSLNLMGGEPTLHPQFFEIFKMALTYRSRNLNFIPINIFSNGLFSHETAELIKREACPIMINVNYPDNYSDSDWSLLKKNLSIVADSKSSEPLLTLSLNIDRPGRNFGYLLELAKQFNIKKIRADLSRPNPNRSNTFVDMEQIPEVIPSLLNFIKKCNSLGITVNMDCALPICCISNKQLQDFAENNVELGFKCSGGIDVTPNLEFWHCAPLRSISFGKITDYANGNEIVNEIERKTHHLRWHVESKKECNSCKWLSVRVCQGGCLSFKNISLIQEDSESGLFSKIQESA